MVRSTVVILVYALVLSGTMTAVDARPLASVQDRLRVFLDCGDCFEAFLRAEIDWVDFVREPGDADVQVLSTRNDTGGGGEEIILRFLGLGAHVAVTQDLRVLTEPGETEDGRRGRVLRAVMVGLLGYLARTGLPDDMRVAVEGGAASPDQAVTSDPWNSWVFEVSSDGTRQSEDSRREVTWEFGSTADRITDAWKFSLGFDLEHRKETFTLDADEGNGELEVIRRERRFEWFVAKSLGAHWSLGVDGNTEASTFGNVAFRVQTSPAIEFNVFPYADYTTRQLRIEYSVGAQYSRYNEITLFGLTRETRPRHQFAATLDQRQPWGTLEAGIEWSQYLHDLSKSRLEFDGELSIRIARGLSLDVQAQASRIRDQLSIPARGATSEEVLLRLRQLQSGHEVDLSFGLTYRFGSIFNNVVNPRFGR